jgi:electron transfer flavoprotein alpha subunit
MAGVLVFGDLAGSELTPASLEAAGAGAALAAALNEPLCGALIGVDAERISEQFRVGFAKLYCASGPHYRPYLAQSYISAAQAIIEACKSTVALFTHTLETREWVPRLAAHLSTGLVLDCTALGIEGAELVATKPVYGGGVVGEFVVRGSSRMASLRAGAFAPATQGTIGEIVRIDVAPPAASRVRFIEESTEAAASGPRLKNAKVIVSGGRGLSNQGNWHYVEEAAFALGAAVGCSRPVADSGWVASSHQVGLSGTCVAPELYIAVGISGAVQHLAGIAAAKTVVAINTDAEAEIFRRANYGVVGDYKDVLPAFTDRVKALKR